MEKNLIKTEAYKTLIENFISLSALQFFNYLFPVITLPYVVRVLGPDKYGLVNFAAAFVAYFISITDYGFNLSATRQISVNREDKEKINKIFLSVMVSKIILAIISSLVFLILIFSIKIFRSEYLLYLITFLMVFSSVLFPYWIYQGMERMRLIAVINILPKMAGVILIFILVREQEDYLVFAAINSLVLFVSGLMGLIFAIRTFRLELMMPDFDGIKAQFSEGFNLFKSYIAINIYTTTNTFVLGLFTNNEIVGFYSAADRIRVFLQSLLAPVSQSVFPFVNYLLKESKEKMLSFNRKLLNYQVTAGFIISLFSFIFAEQIINLVLGESYINSVSILKIICWLPFIIYLSNVYGIQTMLPLGYDKEFFYIVGSAALLNITAAVMLVPQIQAIGTAIAIIITEIFVTVSMILFLSRKEERLY